MRLLSVNIGALETIPGVADAGLTGIFKRPVDHSVGVGVNGLERDQIGSVKYHGGPDQAVYVYSQEDYDWWSLKLGRNMLPGIFGENFTVSDWGGEPPRLGDQWSIGDCVLELTGPRIPCVTLAQRMEDPGFVKRFLQAGRSGAYARVLVEGEVRAGQEIRRLVRRPQYPSIGELNALWSSRPRDPAILRSALQGPVAVGLRADLEKWLERTEGRLECQAR